MLGWQGKTEGEGPWNRVYCPLPSEDGVGDWDSTDSSTDYIFLDLEGCSAASLTTSKFNNT